MLLALAGCTFSQTHPAVTAGIAGGVVGFGGCYVDGVKTSTCGIVGGAAALFLGGIAAIVTLIADTNAPEPPPSDEELGPNGTIRVHTQTPLPPLAPDAGVADAAASDAAAADAAPIAVPPAPDAAPAADAGVDSAP